MLPLMGVVGGATQIVGSLIGGRRRRREAREAAAEFAAQKQALQDFQFQNPYAGLENVAEDLTINQQAAQFQAQQTDAALAQALQTAAMTGGGAGGAQAIAQAALRSKAGISADIAKQEAANQMAMVNQAGKLQQLEAQGADVLQQRQFQQTQQLLNLAADRKNAADAARAQATAGLIGGIGSMVGGIGTGIMGMEGGTGNNLKDFGKSLLTSVGGIPQNV